MTINKEYIYFQLWFQHIPDDDCGLKFKYIFVMLITKLEFMSWNLKKTVSMQVQIDDNAYCLYDL